MKLSRRLKQLLKSSLAEDIGSGDVTTDSLIPKNAKAKAVILAKAGGIFCGLAIGEFIFRSVDSSLKLKWQKRDGDKIRHGNIICNIHGSAHSILKAERTFLNFISWLSGISTETYEFVKRVRGTHAKIYDTRKTTPLWREIEKYAVRIGGGCNHRMGLWDQGFIKDNHWQLIGNSEPVAKKIRSLQSKKWVVEIAPEHRPKLEAILLGKPKIILLDNFSLAQLRKEVQSIKKLSKAIGIQPELEASGGIHLKNVRQIAKTGVDRISIGSITHSARALDFSLEIEKI